ncbi:MAG: NAD-dependent epimerase/dehydratase family protein [Xanthobacteraceae bacterium]
MNKVATSIGRNQRILVTGGCGFLGSNMAAALARSGRDVVAFDNLSRAGTEVNARWLAQEHRRVTVEIGDIRERDTLRRLVEGVDAVMHLAAQVAVTTSMDDPITDFEINARGTLDVLEAVRRYNPDAALIFASTNKVYGRLLDDADIVRSAGRYVPADATRWSLGVSEDAPLDLHSPYGCSKGAADQYVRDYARVFDLRTVVLRMSCIYGPRQFGNEDQGWIAHFLLQAMRNSPITIYGDGYQVRDALFVGDAVDAWIKALDHIDVARGRTFNLGGGPANAVSLNDLLDLIADLRGRRPECRFADWRPGDQPWYVSDVRTISAALGWQPHTGLREGLRALAQWLDSRTTRPAVLELQEARA